MLELEDISLSSIYQKRKNDRDIFQELMPYKVKEVLLIATKYDAYSIVREGQFSDRIFGEYLQLNLYSYPRFTSASTMGEVRKAMKDRRFDLVIIMAGIDRESPMNMAKKIADIIPGLPILLLANNNNDLVYFGKVIEKSKIIDRVFVWNGNSTVFLAMIKYIEDKKNVAKDTDVGNVRVILLVEDSVKYYSRYLPLLYTTVMLQTQNLVSDESTDELHKILKLRARPKILLVSTYEEAIKVFKSYKDQLLCVISDVCFERNGIDDEDAGIRLLKYVKSRLKYPMPILLQSHDVRNAKRADSVEADFINKNSESLSMDIHNFIHQKLGFGNFIFRMPDGRKIAKAHTLEEFQELFKKIPNDSIVFHARENAFSRWLMARGEIIMAELLLPVQVHDFDDTKQIRSFCLDVFEEVRQKKMRGRIVNFSPGLVDNNRFILRLGKGSLGGKGRGMAFISNFIENIEFKQIIPDINIRIPATAIIGAWEFDNFLESNDLYDKVIIQQDYNEIERVFVDSQLSDELNDKLEAFLRKINKPLAIRSSGLFEDSLMQPFSGVYSTYLLPNNHEDFDVRLEQLKTAIKLVYASTFTRSARMYFNAVNYKIEEEKMAVIIQEVVGNEHEGKYYPHISGIAQSYNYYPVSHMQPEDGFAVAAIGLGAYVVGGEKAYRFCPSYPKINPSSIKDQIKDTQTEFLAIDMTKTNFDLIADGENATIARYRVKQAEKDVNLENCVSTYDYENDWLIPGLSIRGPRVVDFANLLKYNVIPFADTLKFLLRIFKEALGTPVEIEYSIDMENSENNNLPTFYLLQIKPLIRKEETIKINIKNIDPVKTIIHANQGMGNGKIKEIFDVIYGDVDNFDRTNTRVMAVEINEMNQKMIQEKRNYVLIGPGRWGTRDCFTGIPVLWSNISNAKIIVEMGLPDFPLDSSLGSHFFHNVTSMNVGYFSIPFKSRNSFINLDKLKDAELMDETKYIKHVRFNNALTILMDGRVREAVISI